MAKDIEELYKLVSAKTRSHVRRESAKENAKIALDMLRKKRGLSQGRLAALLRISQARVSRIEQNVESLKVSSMRKYIKALGGELEIRAKFPNDGFSIEL